MDKYDPLPPVAVPSHEPVRPAIGIVDGKQVTCIVKGDQPEASICMPR